MRRARSAWVVIPAAIIVALMIAGISYVLLQPENAPTPATNPTPPSGVESTGQDWLQFNGDAQHSGWITQETKISRANVTGLRKLYQATLPGTVDGAPVYLANVPTSAGPRSLLFATTTDGTLTARDAKDGSPVWQQASPAGSCVRNADQKPCYTTSQPTLDPNRQFVYSYGLDGYVHKYAVGDGQEVKSGGWPELTSARTDQEKGSSDLSVVTTVKGDTYLYMAHAYYPDGTRRNQGHLTTINLKDGSQHVFNNTCSDLPDVHFGASGAKDCPSYENGIWARGPVVYSPQNDKIYFMVGCCTFDPTQHQWGHSVLALNPDGTGRGGEPLDSYTMKDWQKLDEAVQLASTAPVILPTPTNSKIPHLAVQAGKDGKLRLLNLDDLSGQHSPGHVGGEVNGKYIGLPQNAPVFTQLAVWVNPADGTTWLYVATTKDLLGYRLETDATGQPDLKLGWQKSLGGTSSPVIVNNLIYYVRSNEVMVVEPQTGEQRWHNEEIGAIHWQSPILVNGVLYITDQDNKLTAYSLP